MRLRLSFRLIALLGALAAVSSGAQTFAPPTDVELSAAYCMGVVQGQIARLEKSISTADRTGVEVLKPMLREVQDRAIRLDSYIIPRIGYLDMVPIAMAKQRGDSDNHAYWRIIETELPKCRGTNDTLACGQAKLRALEVEPGGIWQRIDRCKRLEFLPF